MFRKKSTKTVSTIMSSFTNTIAELANRAEELNDNITRNKSTIQRLNDENLEHDAERIQAENIMKKLNELIS